MIYIKLFPEKNFTKDVSRLKHGALAELDLSKVFRSIVESICEASADSFKSKEKGVGVRIAIGTINFCVIEKSAKLGC
jgi:hypothetical protein